MIVLVYHLPKPLKSLPKPSTNLCLKRSVFIETPVWLCGFDCLFRVTWVVEDLGCSGAIIHFPNITLIQSILQMANLCVLQTRSPSAYDFLLPLSTFC